MTAPSLVTETIVNEIALLVIDNPPVGALSTGLRLALVHAFQHLAGRSDIRAVVLTGTGSTFIAGADIHEMEAPPERPFLPDVTDAIAAMPIPVIAAINGTCLGGGAEIALACDARFAIATASIGFPETKLGIIPGAGGTQRLPRLVGLEQAIVMICEARMLKGSAAVACGLVDAVVDDPVAYALARCADIGKRTLSGVAVADADRNELERLRTTIAGKHARSDAVLSALDLVLASRDLAFLEGIRRERKTFLRLRESAAAQALRYLFKAERLASGSRSTHTQMPTIERIAVACAGTMGSGIALSFLQAGFDVLVLERDAEAATRAETGLFSMIDTLAARGRLATADAEASKRRIGFDHNLSAAGNCDLIVEAVFEDYAAKDELFRGLSPHLKVGAIVASNTSYLDIDRLAGMLPDPANVVGMHFFAPATVMKLVEVVSGSATSPLVAARVSALARRIGKVPVSAGNAEGFIGNRIFSAYRQAMEYLVEDGASPKDVDDALEAFGFAMGPFSVFDMSGLDIAWAMRKRNAATRDPQERYVRIADRLCEAGAFGRKTGSGWYDHASPTRTVSAQAQRFIDEERQSNGMDPKPIPAQQIVDVALRTMAKAGSALVESGIAMRASDIDVVLVTGYGFPRDKGGPMYASGLA